MYVAIALFYCALAIAADSAITLVLLVPLLFVVQFGYDEYLRYKQAVRRWR